MMGLNSSVTLAFVIDTTGSMGDEIQQVKELVKRIVNTTRNFAVDYILSPFNDYSADVISRGENLSVLPLFNASIITQTLVTVEIYKLWDRLTIMGSVFLILFIAFPIVDHMHQA